MTNHTNMSKFSSHQDPSYRVLVDAIRGFLAFAPTRELWRAVSSDTIEPIQMMLDLGADPNLQNISGQSALHKAMQLKENAISVVEGLIAKGADIDLRDGEGQTALFIAERESKYDLVRLLLKNGAQLKLEDWEKLAAMKAPIMQKAGKEHPFDKIYMDAPGHSSRKVRRKIERKTYDLEDLDSSCVYACRQSNLSVTYFCRPNDGVPHRYRLKTSVFNALYDQALSGEIFGENALAKFQKESQIGKQESLFTWYHLPANNVSHVVSSFQSEYLICIPANRWHGLRYVEFSRKYQLLATYSESRNFSRKYSINGLMKKGMKHYGHYQENSIGVTHLILST